MDQEQRERVAERVKEAREERGWSQARLADEAQVSENTVLSIEQAARKTQGGKLRRVLDALGIAGPVDDSLDLDGVPEDVRIFLQVAAQRLKVETPDVRARILADVYPRFLRSDLRENGDAET